MFRYLPKIIKRENRGFTLLELLVVIAIIGVLASAVFMGYPYTREKAILGNAMRFSDNLRGALQQDMVAWWKFDEGSGNTAKDSWWNGINGTVSGASWSQGIINGALSFDSNGYVGVAHDASLNNNGKLTVSLWAYSNLADWDNGSFPSLIQKGTGSGWSSGQYFISMWSDKLRFHVGSATVDNVAISYPSAQAWHHLAMTYNGTTLNAYVDGKSVGSIDTDNKASNTASLWIGKSSSGTFSGLLDDVQIYSAAVSLAAIQELYAQGLKSHNFLAEK